jgi:hypothetical protein
VQTHISSYYDWIEGRPIVSHFPKRQIEDFLPNQIKVDSGKLVAAPLTKLWFSFSFKEDIKNFIFVDLDFKKLDITDEEKLEFKEEIISLIQIDEVLKERVHTLCKSGLNPGNGLHILLRNVDGFTNKEMSKSNFILYLTLSVSSKYTTLFKSEGFVDTTSDTKARWMKSLFDIKFEHLNTNSNWTDIEINMDHKLDVPESYLSGFHDKLFKWCSRTSLSEQAILELYRDDLDKRPFKDPNIKFGDTLQRFLKKYLGNNLSTPIPQTPTQSIFIFDKNGKQRVDGNALADLLFSNWNFIKDGTDFIYLKKKGSNMWKIYYKDAQFASWPFIPEILEDLNILDIEKGKMVHDKIIEILKQRTLKGDLPKRDLDGRDSVVFVLKTKLDEIIQIKVTKDSVELINKDFISGVEVEVPIEKIDLRTDWKEFPVWKKGFFRNSIGKEDEYLKIIGYLNHMDPSTPNGLRFVIHSDSTEQKKGGNGKTLATKIATGLRRRVDVSYKKGSDDFWLQNLDTTSQILYIDEFPKDGDIEKFREFYNISRKSINKKFKHPIYIDPFKVIISSNYNLSESNPDRSRRVEVSFKNYYNRDTNPFSKELGGYQAMDDTLLRYHKSFVNDLGETIDCNLWWNQYIAFIIHCVQLYLNDMNRRFTDLVDPLNKLYQKHESYLESTAQSIIYNEVMKNLDNILSGNKNEYLLRNCEICDTSKYRGRTLGIILHMVETYLTLFTQYSYDGKKTDRYGVIHKIKRNI